MLAEDIEALLDPAAYPGRPDRVDLIQTHISDVFLAGDHVFKVKKPVNLGFLDFSTLERRRHFCAEEVRLNSRFCPGLYYGVEPLLRSATGLRFGGSAGDIVDYAVHMRRLPPGQMMDVLLGRDELDLDLIGSLVDRLVHFYSAQDGVPPAGNVETFERHWLECFGGPWAVPMASRLDPLHDSVQEAIARTRPDFLAREAAGRVVDGHGDLRCESVCFDFPTPGNVCISDCIEFDPTLRIGDSALELGFLAMDMEARGRPDLSDLLVGLYLAASGDTELPLVLDACKSYRALVRARVEWLRANEGEVRVAERAKAGEASDRCLALAEDALARDGIRPPLVLVHGSSGSGKSVLAGALAARLGAVLISTDLTRKRLAGLTPTARVAEEPGAGIYGADMSVRVYDAINQEAARHLGAGHAVVVDGTFLFRSQREALAKIARTQNVEPLFVECHAPEAVIRQRQAARRNQPWRTTDGTFAIYVRQSASVEPVTAAEATLVRVDTTTPIASQLTTVMSKMRRGSYPP